MCRHPTRSIIVLETMVGLKNRSFRASYQRFGPVIGFGRYDEFFCGITGVLDWRFASSTDYQGVDGNLLVVKSHPEDDTKTMSSL